MNISIFGTGNVGLVTGACLAHVGNNVVCYDIDKPKIRKLQKGNIDIFESGLSKIVLECLKNKNLHLVQN